MSEASSYQEQELVLKSGKVRLLEAGSGSPIVVLHHSWGNAGWLPYHDELAKTHRVIVPDMPGWGGSERPAWAREPRDIAILIGRVLDRLSLDGVMLVGLGFGGFIAAELATMNPSRLASLALIGTAGVKPREGEILDQMLMSHTAYMQAGFRNEAKFVEQLGEEPPADVRELWDHSREMTARVTWKPYMFNRRLEHLLPDLQVPTLIIWGAEDKVVPVECAGIYGELIDGATVEIIDDAGHLVELEEPQAVAKLLSGFSK